MKEKITSLSTVWGEPPSSGSGGGESGVVNQVLLQYNDFGQLTADFQEHDGAVSVTTTRVVRYEYSGGNAGHVRLTRLVYPHGRGSIYG
jgi:hypothetical protein